MPPSFINVAVGIIIRDGQCLIKRRRAGKHLEGLWEFPGGKCLPGEAPEDCLHREIVEEVGFKIKIEKAFPVIEHAYPDRNVRLHFFRCSPLEKLDDNKMGGEERWVLLKNLVQYRFPEANQSILKLLKD